MTLSGTFLLFEGGIRGATKFAGAVEARGSGLGTSCRASARGLRQLYDQELAKAQREYPKKAGKIEQHHVDPKYMGGDPSGPLEGLDGAYHQKITNEFRKEHPYGQGTLSPAERAGIRARVYARYPLPSALH